MYFGTSKPLLVLLFFSILVNLFVWTFSQTSGSVITELVYTHVYLVI